MIRRRLPIGIQTFRKIREDNCYYFGWQFITDSVKVIRGLP